MTSNMRRSERRTAVRSHLDDFHVSAPSDARSRPPSLILFSLGLMLPRDLILLIGIIVSTPVVLATRKGRRGTSAMGCAFAFMGIVSLLDHRIIQRWHGGAPLEGPLATIGSILLIAIGIYALYLAFFWRSDGDNHLNENDQT